MEPDYIVVGPSKLYIAPAATTKPEVHVAAPEVWKLLGSTKAKTQEGTTITTSQTLGEFKGDGSTLPVKMWRTDEEIKISQVVADLTVETLAQILDEATVTTVAGAEEKPGSKQISLVRGTDVHEYAVLLRTISPYEDNLSAQWYFSRCAQTGNPAPKHSQASAAELAVEFTLLEDLTSDAVDVYEAEIAA